MERQASVYRKPDGFVFLSSSQTEGVGLSIGNGHVIRRAVDASAADLHEALMLSLAQSNLEPIPHPPSRADWSAHDEAYLKQIGFRSFKQLECDADYCVATLDDGTITFDVARPNGPGKGYDFTGEEICLQADEQPEAIIKTLRSALDKCAGGATPTR